MHTRRISAFLLGAWMSGCLLMAFVYVRSLDIAGLALNGAPPPLADMVNKLGYDPVAQLVRHAGSELVRRLTDSFELTQVLLALALMGCLFLATQRRVFPLVVCGLMLVLVLFQHFAVSPELAYRGRDVDFPPGNTNVSLITRVWALRQVYFGLEIVKLLAGGLLASYLFVFRTSRRVRKEKPALHEVD